MDWFAFLNRPQDTHFPWLKTINTHWEGRARSTARGCNQGWLLHTLFVFRVHSAFHFPSASISLSHSLPRLLPFPPNSRESLAKVQNYSPFLVSKQVILFSIPVPTETAIIYPLQKVTTLRRDAGNARQNKCWSWFGRERLLVTFHNKHRTSGLTAGASLNGPFQLFLQEF